MDFPDLGAPAERQKRNKLPPPPTKNRGAAQSGGQQKPKSALEVMTQAAGVNKARAAAANGLAAGARSGAAAGLLEGLAEIGPRPVVVPEPDAAAHQQVAAAIQARIDEAEKRVSEVNAEVERLKGLREERKDGMQSLKARLRAIRDQIRANSAARDEMPEHIKAAAEELKKQEAKTIAMAKELTSTDEAISLFFCCIL
jgi:hypothetical protein